MNGPVVSVQELNFHAMDDFYHIYKKIEHQFLFNVDMKRIKTETCTASRRFMGVIWYLEENAEQLSILHR